MPMKQLDPVFDGWKTLLSPSEGSASGHFEIYAPSAWVTIIYNTSGKTQENYYIIDSNSSGELTEITNYSYNNDVLSFDWSTKGTGLAVYCATNANLVDVDISTQSLATGGTTQWMGEVIVDANNVNTDYILWGWRVTGLNYHFSLHKLSEPKNDNFDVNTSIVSSTDTTITLNVSFVSDFMPQALFYKVIPACEIEGV